MDRLGFAGQWEIQADKLVVRSQRTIVEKAIRKAYGIDLLKDKAKKFGWNAKQQPDGKWIVQKATF